MSYALAVIGPKADSVIADWYGGDPPYTVTALQGIQNRLGSSVEVSYAADNSGSIAAGADAAVVFVGNHPTCNAGWAVCDNPYEGKETTDRQSIDLEPAQLSLIQDVYADNPNTIVVLISSFPQAIGWVKDNIPAVLHIADSGQELGNALADVLFGDYNPAGRLSMTWYASTDQLPDIMDYGIRGKRTYMYFTGTPLFPFGHGLSYTEFDYTNLRLSADTLSASGQVTVSVDISNIGDRDGEETAQLYVSFPDSAVERPIRALSGFKRLPIAAGATETFSFVLKGSDLKYWNESADAFTVEPGNVNIEIGASSADIRLTDQVTVTP